MANIDWIVNNSILKELLETACTILITWFTTRNHYTNNKKEQESNAAKNIAEEKARDLESIISPAIYALEISRCIEHPNYYHVLWYERLLKDDNDLNVLIRKVLSNNIDPCGKDLNIILDFIKEGLERKYDVVKFMDRYNIGTKNKVCIDIIQLNKDIEFINATLGRNYMPIGIRN